MAISDMLAIEIFAGNSQRGINKSQKATEVTFLLVYPLATFRKIAVRVICSIDTLMHCYVFELYNFYKIYRRCIFRKSSY